MAQTQAVENEIFNSLLGIQTSGKDSKDIESVHK